MLTLPNDQSNSNKQRDRYTYIKEVRRANKYSKIYGKVTLKQCCKCGKFPGQRWTQPLSVMQARAPWHHSEETPTKTAHGDTYKEISCGISYKLKIEITYMLIGIKLETEPCLLFSSLIIHKTLKIYYQTLRLKRDMYPK